MEIKSEKKLVCIGDIIPDLIIPYGEMKRFMGKIDSGDHSTENKGPLAFMRPGGAMANTAVALGKLGIRPQFVGKVSRDSLSGFLVEDLIANNVDVSYLAYQNEPALVIVAVIEQSGEKVFFQWFPPGGKDKVLLPSDLPISLAQQSDWIHINGTVVQDSGESSVNVTEFVEKSAQLGKTISIDLNLRAEVYPMTEGRRALLSRVLKVSRYIFGSGADEWCILSGVDDLAAAARSYSTKENTVICRDGANPVILFDKGSVSTHPVPNVNVVSRLGAGDIFDAGFLAGILSGCDAQESVLWGNAAASFAISHEQPRSVPDPQEMERLILLQK